MTKVKVSSFDNLSRRALLRGFGGCAALSQTSLLSTIATLGLTRTATAAIDTTGYKAIVCLFLFGGIDSYNMLVPMSEGESTLPYDDYALARSSLALPAETLLPISDPVDGRGYGLNPVLGGMHSLYQNGNLAFVANVGALIEPVEFSNYRNGARLPLGLYSHSDSQRQWQTCVPQSRTQITGWLGRMADLLNDATNSNPAISMNIAIDSLNILQTGDGIAPYVVDDRNGAEVLSGYNWGSAMDRIMTASTDSYLSQGYGDLLKSTFGDYRRQAIDAAADYNIATENVVIDPAIVTELQSTRLGTQLLQVARAIGARNTLGQQRQVFFTFGGGWDNHSALVPTQSRLLTDLDSALSNFYAALVDLGVENDVITYSASDFARTLNANSNQGSDHAWGGNHFVMGGDVAGGQLYGTYPYSLAPGNSLDVGRGRMIPTLSVDEYSAEMALWFGIENDSNLENILPNIRNFYGAGDTLPPLGFTGGSAV